MTTAMISRGLKRMGRLVKEGTHASRASGVPAGWLRSAVRSGKFGARIAADTATLVAGAAAFVSTPNRTGNPVHLERQHHEGSGRAAGGPADRRNDPLRRA